MDKNRSETLNVGEQAPEFKLLAANQLGEFSLAQILQRGLAILEFLRGTW